jgi:hypothetical protein
MSCYKNFEEYVSIIEGQFPKSFVDACNTSEFQHLDKTAISINILENGGIFPNYMYLENNSIPLISMQLKKLLTKLGVDNLFYKQVNLVEENLGINETYYLALPPRIRCLDDSCPVEFDGCIDSDNIYIDSSRVGNYKIFKLADVLNNDIIVTSTLKDEIESLHLEGIFFSPIH